MSLSDPLSQPLQCSIGTPVSSEYMSLERVAFAATVFFAAGLMWWAPRLPMTDLPQHAAQVALWRDLIQGHSSWSDLVRINLFTPYLIGYGLALPLSFLFPMSAAVKIVLTAALLGFVGVCTAFRRTLGGDARLDWLFLVGFFGFAWQWGFLTFLAATPVGIAFLLACHNPVGAMRRRNATIVVLGALLLFCHGLMFVALLPIGASLAAWPRRRGGWRSLAGALVPFLLLGTVCLAFRLLSAQAEGAMRFDKVLLGSDLWLKPMAALLFVTDVNFAKAGLGLPATLVLILAPPLLGARLNRGVALVPFVGLSIVILALPSYAFQTALLFQRFAVFLLPFYALMFRPPAPSAAPRPAWFAMLPALACWIVLGVQADRIRGFAAETQPFETVLAAAEPGRRALSLVFDPASPAAANGTAFLHLPLWYQAEKGGFVDFNFAAFHPQVVRFKSGRQPDFTEVLGWHPDRFDGSVEHTRLFDYIFVRGTPAETARVIAVSACPLTVRAADGPWTLLERGPCPPTTGVPAPER